MIYGVIDEKSRKYYTFLGDVFDAIGDEQLNYNWLITDSDIVAHSERLNRLNTKQYYQYVDGKAVPIPAPEYYFLSGKELSEIVRADDAQWIWGVLSGFDPGIPLEEILRHPLPTADGCEGFWTRPPALQHPLAALEIVPWDSSCVLLFSRRRETADRFRAAFPASRDLEEYNREGEARP